MTSRLCGPLESHSARAIWRRFARWYPSFRVTGETQDNVAWPIRNVGPGIGCGVRILDSAPQHFSSANPLRNCIREISLPPVHFYWNIYRPSSVLKAVVVKGREMWLPREILVLVISIFSGHASIMGTGPHTPTCEEVPETASHIISEWNRFSSLSGIIWRKLYLHCNPELFSVLISGKSGEFCQKPLRFSKA